MKRSGKSPSSVLTRMLRASVVGATALFSTGLLASGCLDRPVSPSTPNTTNVFVDQIKQTTVDKIDLLFMIDNSISMADKQTFLAEAVPQLVNRLINARPAPGSAATRVQPRQEHPHRRHHVESRGTRWRHLRRRHLGHAQRPRASGRNAATRSHLVPEPRIPVVGSGQQVRR